MDKLQTGQMIEWEDLDKRKYYLFGPSLFFFVRGFIYPFNLIKTRLFMQQQSNIYSGTFDAFQKIFKHEGVRGLYKGFIVSAFGLISGQMYITTYEIVRSYLGSYHSELRGLIAGASATLVAQTITVPVDVVSQTMMMQGQVVRPPKKIGGYIIVKNSDYIIPRSETTVKLKGAISIARDLVKKEGIRGLYKGYQVSLLTYAPNSALWWAFYIGCYRMSAERGATDVLPIPVVQAYSGVFSATLAATLTNPLDVLRTRYQVHVCYTWVGGGDAFSLAISHQILAKNHGL